MDTLNYVPDKINDFNNSSLEFSVTDRRKIKRNIIRILKKISFFIRQRRATE